MRGTDAVSIIIVNYNTASYIKRCLASIRNNIGFDNAEVLIADNNSPERDIEKITEEFPEVRLIFRKENSGFGDACNDAAGKAECGVILFLNPDTVLRDDSILRLRSLLHTDPESGIVSGLLTDSNGVPMYCFNEFPDLKWEFFQTFGTGYESQIRKLLNREEIRTGKRFETDWFHGAFLMMRKDDFQRAGGFNKQYFMYFEDVELCYIFQKVLRLKNICDPAVRIGHATQSSLESETLDNIRNFHMHRGKLIFIRKYGFVRRMIFRMLGIMNVTMRALLLGIWPKYKGQRTQKLHQLLNILRLYISPRYLENSKFEYIRK
ncbi:MAG: glycosyltransferase family 2 protein [Ignavibacteria bacterium]|nr:glycosyltransferase family 2 protein [Ignavibacteria bacterium]